MSVLFSIVVFLVDVENFIATMFSIKLLKCLALNKFIFMKVTEQVNGNRDAVVAVDFSKNDKPAFQFYVLKTHRLEQIGLYKGDHLLIEMSNDLIAGNIILIDMDGKLLLRRLEQSNHAWILKPLHQQLAALEWPFHFPLPVVGIVRQIIRQI